MAFGAADGNRTRNNQLGRLTLCQLNYRRVEMERMTRLELATTILARWRSTKLSYIRLLLMVVGARIELATSAVSKQCSPD